MTLVGRRRAALAAMWVWLCALAWPLVVLGQGAPPSKVTRAEIIQRAEQYLRLKWTPTQANAFHGKDAAGRRVDTPDIGFQPRDGRPGWWKPGTVNVGMPYKWGGFDTPETFLKGVRAGRAAGDVYTLEKRRLLEAAVSDQAVGIDCSGFISRCWQLPKAYSTRTFHEICEPLASVADLKPGDILNTNNAHVLMFAGWATSDRKRLRAYEAGSPPTWKVLLNEMSTGWLLEKGYRPMRYRGVRD
jgi:hypothetical protein